MLLFLIWSGCPVDAKGDGDTPLCQSVKHFLVNATWLLLAHGKADPNLPDADGRTPLMLAAERDRRDMARLLLDFGADPDLKSPEGQDCCGRRPCRGSP